MSIKTSIKYGALFAGLVLLQFSLSIVVPTWAEDSTRIKYDYVTDNPDSGESQPKPSDSKAEGDKKLEATKLFEQVTKLVKEYFPKAKIKRKGQDLHVEYKSRPYVIASTNKVEKGPKWGGIVFDMKLQEGKYKGVHSVPKKFNEYSFFHVVLMAPYSEQSNCHLWTRVSYPFDVPPEFLKRLTNITNSFESYL